MRFIYFVAGLVLLLVSACGLTSGVSPTTTEAAQSPLATATMEAASPSPESTATTAPPAATQTQPTNTEQPTATQQPTLAVTGTSSPLPAGRYSVILVAEGDVLNIRSAAGVGNPVVGEFPPGVPNVMATGERATVSGDLWLQVENPSGGSGWVNAWYLTETVPPESFCNDARVATLLADFKRALNEQDGDLLASLVSPVHGLEVYYWSYGRSANYTTEEASWVFQSTFDVNWGAGPSGMDDVGTFSEVPLPELLDVVNDADYEQQCNNLSSVEMIFLDPWPPIYQALNFYALYKPATPGIDLDWKTWLAGVEYVQGQPYLMVLRRFVWEP